MESKILKKLDIIQSDLKFIKEHVSDIVLTTDDEEALESAEQDYEKGRTKRLV